MLRRNGPVIKPWSQSWGRKGVYGGMYSKVPSIKLPNFVPFDNTSITYLLPKFVDFVDGVTPPPHTHTHKQ